MRSTIQILSLFVLGFAILVGGLVSPTTAGEVPLPKPAKAFKGEQCVEPVDLMRRDHMTFLKHQRDDTLREGIRGNKYSLNQCIDCHAVTSPDVNEGKTRTVQPFCAECHEYAAVTIDCFQCHTDTAQPGLGEMPANHPTSSNEGTGQ